MTSIIRYKPVGADGNVETAFVLNAGTAVSYAERVASVQYGAPSHGMIKAGTVATQMPSVACDKVMFKAHLANTGTIWIGGSGVTAAGTATNTVSGYPLSAGQELGWIETDSLNRFYYICSGTVDHLAYFTRG